MDDAAGAVIGAILQPIVDDTYSQIKRYCNYLCGFKNNVQILTQEAAILEAERETLQMKVDDAMRDGRKIRAEVKKWLEETNQNQAQMTDIENSIPRVQCCCSNIKSRYSLSKRAKRTAEAMEKLRDRNNFGDDISLPPPPASMEPFPLEAIITLQSRKQIEEMIVEALGRPDVNIIGIGGTGGIGKTCLAEKIINRMLTEKLFDEAVKAVVSQSVDLLGIQQSIAAQVCLKLDSETDKVARAHQLRTRLKSTGKKIIVLDDVWWQLHFEEIGIPSPSDSSGCKILLTSRNSQLLNQMGAQVFSMKILNEDDAWSLFEYKAGTCVKNSDLKPTAEKVLAECKGLPIAIVTVGSALKDQRIEVWQDALLQLEDANPTDIDGVENHVYNSLRLSYSYLESEGAKSLFLLCCIFPEDFEISLECLAIYGMALNMFDRGDSLSRARNQVFTIVEKLKSCSLLLDGKDEYHVKMHDVVRDVARFIAREKKLIDEQLVLKGQSVGNCKWAFIQESYEGSNYKIRTNFQCLHLLIIQRKTWHMMTIDDFPCVGRMPDLKVLSLERSSFKSSLQLEGLLKYLKTLELIDCPLKNLSFIKELEDLEILKCKWCTNIEELSIEIGNLKRLKLLDLTGCRKLKRIKAGIISKLIELEELKMLDSFREWESTKIVNKEDLEWNASLKELGSLKKLTWLEIGIADIELVKENMSLPESIAKYDIQIGSYKFTHKDKPVSSYPCLLTKHNHCFRSWIHKFVSAAEELCLDGNWSRRFIPSDCFGSKIKTLQIENGVELVSLINTLEISTDLKELGIFPVLECMKLKNLPHLTHICDGPVQRGSKSFKDLRELNLENLPSLTQVLHCSNQNVSFNNLSEIRIHKCNGLRNLFLLEKIEDVFWKLEKLFISECEKMDEVFLIEKTEQIEKNSKLAFPNMVKMEIRKMPNLTNFGKGIGSIEFPSLTELCLEDCPKLKWIDSEDRCTDDEYSLHYFCSKKVPFSGLKGLDIRFYDDVSNLWCQQIPPCFFHTLEFLEICECHKLKSAFPYLVAKHLLNLKEIFIWSCQQMELVVSGVEKETHEQNSILLFPNLVYLFLMDIPSLEMFCERGCCLTLPSLESMNFEGKTLRRSTHEGNEDWNNLLCQHITPKMEEELLRHNRLASQAATDEELNKDELHVEAIPSLSGQEFGSHNAPDMAPRPVPDQAESSTTAAQRSATMDKMRAVITYPDQLIEQQSAQHDG